jgi:hypothetical protein
LYGVALPQGFGNNKVWFLIDFFVDLLFMVIIFADLFRFLTIGIKAIGISNKEDFAYCPCISIVVLLYSVFGS